MASPLSPLSLPAGLAALAAVAAQAASPERMPLEEIRPGASAVARTVLRGTEIGEFGVEILSVVRRVAPDRDVILARGVGEEIERIGVAQGMSGSPVYVDGKLVGALASTWSFAREPVFGITPAGQMAAEAEGALSSPGPGRLFRDGRPPDAALHSGLERIRSPLALAGFDPRVTSHAAKLFEPWGFRVSEGGAAGEGDGGVIEPGAVIGVQLVGGDMNMTAFGTVTWVEEDRVHAWGHPFFQMGDVEMPLVSGFVHAVVPSRALSFKLAGGGDVVGTLTSDRGSGISGRLGQAPRTTELRLGITRDGERTERRFELVRSRFLLPTLVGLTAASSVLAGEGAVAEETVRFRQRIVLDDGRDTVVETLLSGEQNVPAIVDLLSQATQVVAANPFEDVEVDRIEAELSSEPGVRLGLLTQLSVDDGTPAPGDAIRGSYTIRDYRGAENTHRFSIPVPESAPEGRYLLLAADMRTAEQYEAERDPRTFSPRTLDELLERIRGLRQTDRVHLHLYRRSEGVQVHGRPLADLPPSALAVMRGARGSGVRANLPAELVHETRLPAGRFVVGAHTVLLEVRKEKP